MGGCCGKSNAVVDGSVAGKDGGPAGGGGSGGGGGGGLCGGGKGDVASGGAGGKGGHAAASRELFRVQSLTLGADGNAAGLGRGGAVRGNL